MIQRLDIQAVLVGSSVNLSWYSTMAVRIEVQDQFGVWHQYTTVSDNPANIKQSLQTALRSQLASKSKKARAVDKETGSVIDILQG